MSTNLIDSFGRKHTYLRLSITDSCNFRCLYCMPDEPFSSSSSSKLMSSDEIFGISKIFTEQFGISKIRITGGEPLVRNDFAEIIEKLATLQVSLGVTTNGVLLDKYFSLLQQNQVQLLNISIDSLDSERFKQITKRDLLPQVWNNIMQSISLGFKVKLNAVIMRGVNDDELLSLAMLSHNYPIEMRFIEFMPFYGNSWEKGKVMPINEMLQVIDREYSCIKLHDDKHDTSRKYKLSEDSKGCFGFITTMSNAFCGGCNRIRLTSDGKMKNCLFGAEEFDLLSLYRAGEDIGNLIKEGVWRKHKEKGGQFTEMNTVDNSKIINRSMIKIGG
ncbi:GTP 3',8-cyclase MoaA [Capnocytophaga sputigena]|uniref:GTP 3',8-cyclase MoaA n=1 Tax=Capnocytophaga sputigena TaxID=1019 RepID=UPI0028D6E20F|nr:GTP 3',8-cyclase MoaA [Capnocytophaga sputigena]